MESYYNSIEIDDDSIDDKDPYRKINNIVELPYKGDNAVVDYLKNRYVNDKIHTWAGQTLLIIHPYERNSIRGKQILQDNQPSIDSLVAKICFRISREGFGQPNQTIVISGESGSGKTYSSCLALKYISHRFENQPETDLILWKAWNSVPLLTAFGNAPTTCNNNSSRFGKLLQLQYWNGQIKGAHIETYLLEKCRVSGLNPGEGNFHIFQQILTGLDEDTLRSVHLNKLMTYLIASKNDKQPRSMFNETMKALDVLEIYKFNEILSVLSIILNLGNVAFELNREVYAITPESITYLLNASKLLQVDELDLIKLLTTKTFTTVSTQSSVRRGSVYDCPCTYRDECEIRKNCLMRYLYEAMFLWLVQQINLRINACEGSHFHLLGLLDIYGFEVFCVNHFEQLCINYANERLHAYYVKDYLIKRQDELVADGFKVDKEINMAEFNDRVALIDGPISIFGILNEECLVKRFNNDVFINTRLIETLKSRPYFVGSLKDFNTNFAIKHFAGQVTYDTKNILHKNRDKVPEEMLIFLQNSELGFLKEIMKVDLEHTRNQTLLNKFKKSLDKLIYNLENSCTHYIKCLKPNPAEMAKLIDEPFFLNQLRINGVLDILHLSFQKYAIKLNFNTFVQKYSCRTFNILHHALVNDIQVGHKLIYMTEKGFHAFEMYEYIQQCSAARKIQRLWRSYSWRRNQAARIIQKVFRRLIGKETYIDSILVPPKQSNSSASFPSCLELAAINSISNYKKTQNYVNNSVGKNFEGDPLSLLLEKVYMGLKTKPFHRILYCGNGIISYSRLAEIPVRIYLSRTCIRNAHLLPKSEMPKGLLDIF